MQKGRKIVLIGLTGGVATGKSTVAAMFSRLGFPTVDTDKVAHCLMKKGTAGHKKIVALFGDAVLLKNGDIDREKIAKRIFQRSANATRLRRRLEAILHPAIWKYCRSLAKVLQNAGKRFLVIEVPLLFETGWNKRVDIAIVASCRRKEETSRCKGSFKKRIPFQIPLYLKEGMADLIITTSGSKRETYLQVKMLSQMIDKAFPS